ncbi:MAG: hypothetical protein H0X62_14345 [Bacteroidetes bacterium]|nr:hypothetical protein [Bacteroidota bacterium]
MDGIKNFFSDFNIDPVKFAKWGIKNTKFPDPGISKKVWLSLCKEIEREEKPVYIREYGNKIVKQEAYLEFLNKVIPNANIDYDKRNNVRPRIYFDQALIVNRNNFKNYTITHIWGKTKNPYAFNAPWNMAYMPGIVAPFTDHMGSGKIQVSFSKIFKAKAYEKHKESIELFNKKMNELKPKIKKAIAAFDKNPQLAPRDIIDLKKRVEENFSPITLEG